MITISCKQYGNVALIYANTKAVAIAVQEDDFWKCSYTANDGVLYVAGRGPTYATSLTELRYAIQNHSRYWRGFTC